MGSTKKSKRDRSLSESSVERNYKESRSQKKRKHSESFNQSHSDIRFKNDRKLPKKVDKQKKITPKYADYTDGAIISSEEEKNNSSKKRGKDGYDFENRSEKTVYKTHEDKRSRSVNSREKNKLQPRSMSVESMKDSRKSYKYSGGKDELESGYKVSNSSQVYKAEVKYSSSRSDKDHRHEVSDDLSSRTFRNYKLKDSHNDHNESSRKKFSDDKHRKQCDSKKAGKKYHNSSDHSENDTSYRKYESGHKISNNEYIGKSENKKNESLKHRESKKSASRESKVRKAREELSYIDKRKESDHDSDFKEQQFESSEKFNRYWDNKTGKETESTENWIKHPESKNRMEHKVGPRYYNVSVDVTKDKENKEESEIEDKIEKSENNTLDKSQTVTPAQKKTVDLLTSRTGGAYIPPAKLRMMQANITDKSSAAYQRIAWEALKKSIQGHVNKVNISNIRTIVKELQKENIVRGRGLLCRSIIQAQAASPTFTHVYAAFVCAINSKFPNIGELLLKRLVVQFRRGFKRNDKTICISAANFIAHLVNQQVAHEILALQILTLLVENPTDDSVEVAISFLKECGMKLTEVSNKGISAIFDMLRNILHEGSLDKRVQYMIEVMFQIRKDDFKAHPALLEELDIVPEENKIMHIVTLEDNNDPQDILNVFKFDPEYQENEEKYKSLIDEESSDESGDSDGSEGSSEEGSDEDEEESNKGNVIIDRTETNLVILRRTIYLTIQSSLDFEECAHKLLRMQLKPGQEIEVCHMFLDCCAEQRTYEKFFGLLAQRFCQINRSFVGPFEETFRDTYATVHRVDTDKLRNIAKLFAHLLYTDAISWEVLSTIRLNEDDTTSSSRIFIKILFLELSEYMGLAKLNQRVKDPTLQTALDGLFPRDNPKNTRFAINFFTSIGLGGLTDELREHLKAQPKTNAAVPQLVEALSISSESSSSDSSSTSSTSSSESTSEDSSSTGSSSDTEDSTDRKKTSNKKKRVQKNNKKNSENKRGSEKKKRKPSKQRKKKNR